MVAEGAEGFSALLHLEKKPEFNRSGFFVLELRRMPKKGFRLSSLAFGYSFQYFVMTAIEIS